MAATTGESARTGTDAGLSRSGAGEPDVFGLLHAIHLALENQRLIELSDHKAGVFVTACGAALGYLVHSDYQVLFLSCQPYVPWTASFGSLLAFILLGLGALACAVSIIPSFKPDDSSISPMNAHRFMRSSDFAETIARETNGEVVKEILRHAHSIALLLLQKFMFVRIGSYLLLVGLFIAAAVIFVESAVVSDCLFGALPGMK